MLSLIIRPMNSILSSSEIMTLSNSIERFGILQPIIVRATNDDEEMFEIVAGNRRYHACKRLGWRKIPCYIVELDDRCAFEVSLVENLQRRNLGPIEEGSAFKLYVDHYGWGGASELANKIGKSVSYITRRVRLLDLPASVIELISDNSINSSVAEELLPIPDEADVSELGQLIAKRKMSVKELRRLKIERVHNVSNQDQGFDDMLDTTNRSIQNELERKRKIYDKSIVAIRIAMKRLAAIIEGIEEDASIRNGLMKHKNLLHEQIDTLLKEKSRLI